MYKLAYRDGNIILTGEFVENIAREYSRCSLSTKAPVQDYQIVLIQAKDLRDKRILRKVAAKLKKLNLTRIVPIGLGRLEDGSLFGILSFEEIRKELKYLLELRPFSPVFLLTGSWGKALESPSLLNYFIKPIEGFNEDFLLNEIELLTKEDATEEAKFLIETFRFASYMKFWRISLLASEGFHEELAILCDELVKSKSADLLKLAECLIGLKCYRAALLPIWTWLLLHPNNCDSRPFKFLAKCAANGYLGINVLPVKEENLSGSGKQVKIVNYCLTEALFGIYRQLGKREHSFLLRDARRQTINSTESPEDFYSSGIRWVVPSETDSSSYLLLPKEFNFIWPSSLAIAPVAKTSQEFQFLEEISSGYKIISVFEEEGSQISSSGYRTAVIKNPFTVKRMDTVVSYLTKSNHFEIFQFAKWDGRIGMTLALIFMVHGPQMPSGPMNNECRGCASNNPDFASCSLRTCLFGQPPRMNPDEAIALVKRRFPAAVITLEQQLCLEAYCSVLWSRVKKISLKTELFECYGLFSNQIPKFIVISGKFEEDSAVRLKGLLTECNLPYTEIILGSQNYESESDYDRIVITDKYPSQSASRSDVIVIDFDYSLRESADAQLWNYEPHLLPLPSLDLAEKAASCILVKHPNGLVEAAAVIASSINAANSLPNIEYNQGNFDLRSLDSREFEEKLDGEIVSFYLNRKGNICFYTEGSYDSRYFDRHFSSVPEFIQDYQESLKSILINTDRILYGYWLKYKKTVHYTRLPCHFIAFDLLDVRLGFMEGGDFRALLSQTDLHFIRPLRNVNTEASLQLFLKDAKSQYAEGDTPMAGIVCRTRDYCAYEVLNEDLQDCSNHWIENEIFVLID